MPHAHTPGQVVESKCIKECGCRAGADSEGYCEIDLCALHAAAPEMLAMLEKAKAALYNVPEVGHKYDQQHSHTHAQACLDIEQLITRATGRERGQYENATLHI